MSEKPVNQKGKQPNSIDPICGMLVSPKSAYALEECHKRMLFCSSYCRDKYLAKAPKDVDPICHMRVPTSSPYTLEENGHVLRFCSVDCRAVYQQRRKTGQ